ncbi:MAG: Gfo/Idh/MocA family oxidoreductase [Acidobacteria bacterium]|nr:Gfo/Idh/MocA family oxidoreductase [Acidobacteriota bacterium]
MNPLSRRHFFQGASVALSATRVMGANDRINMGVIGLGGRGSSHVGTYLRIPEARITALCDVNQAALERNQAQVVKSSGSKAAEYADMRQLFADKNVDAVSMATPNHWHALGTIWACEAGKDVYCEKPASYNIHEAYRVVDVARKTKRMVQIGSQSRSTPHKIKAMQLLKDGVIGEVYMAKGLCFKRRRSIGKAPVEPVPPGVNWDLFLGPAPMRGFTKLRFAYNWHWFWDTGNGDIGNQGIHEMDVCRWAMGDIGLPKTISSTGGKFVYDDDQETPNTQMATFGYGAKEIMFEVRGLLTGPEGGQPVGTYPVGNLVYGSDGWMWVDGAGFQVYKGEKSEKIMDEKGERGGDGTRAHMSNFLAACRSRNYKDLTAEVEIGATSVILVHMANISYRVGRTLTWDPAKRLFAGDAEANKLITRDYRKPYVV